MLFSSYLPQFIFRRWNSCTFLWSFHRSTTAMNPSPRWHPLSHYTVELGRFFFSVASLHVSKEPPLRLCSPAHYSVQCILVMDLCLLSPLKRHPSHQPSSLDKLHSDQKYQLSDTIWPYHITTKCYQYFCMYFISLLTSKSKNYGKIVSCWLWDPLILGTNLNHFTIIFLPKAHIIV